MKLPPGLALDEVLEALEDYGAGFCLECGTRSEHTVEPNTREYACGECGTRSVYGAKEIMLVYVS